MKKKLPFEEAFKHQLKNVPLPDEDESWHKMKKLLDTDDKPMPFGFFKTYKYYAILIGLLIVGSWYIFGKLNTQKEKQILTTENNSLPKKFALHSPKILAKPKTSKPAADDNLPETKNIKSSPSDQPVAGLFSATPLPSAEIGKGVEKGSKIIVLKKVSKAKENENERSSLLVNKQISIMKKRSEEEKVGVVSVKENSIYDVKTFSDLQKSSLPQDITPIILPASRYTIDDSQNDTLFSQLDVVKKNTSRKTEPLHNNRNYFVSGGIGVQQQIPLAGQSFVQSGLNGNTALSNYIPSIYLRFEREQKWFVQGEFIYGSPQLLKEFAYNRRTQPDSIGGVSTTTLRLKKTFYNELPVSFNYYLHPNLSLGTGVTYSWLRGAIAKKEISTHNTFTQTTSVVEQVVPIKGYIDSFLYKSHTYLMLQADYQWRKLSFELRCTKDLQPYIKYTRPDGSIESRKNWSLQFIVRLRLLKSAKF